MTREDDAKVAELLGWRWRVIHKDKTVERVYRRNLIFPTDEEAPEQYVKLQDGERVYEWYDDSKPHHVASEVSYSGIPHFTSSAFIMDAAADYLVLEFVRENWNTQRLKSLASRLSDTFDDRAADHEEAYENSWNDILMYRPGDYSRAVIAVAEAEESE